MNKLTDEELNRIRNIRIHSLLNVEDNGRRVTIRCPFHTEKTPSFNLYPGNNYHCFGCNKNGNGAIDFCQDLGYTFIESLEELIKYL